jgi:hypothetical protein
VTVTVTVTLCYYDSDVGHCIGGDVDRVRKKPLARMTAVWGKAKPQPTNLRASKTQILLSRAFFAVRRMTMNFSVSAVLLIALVAGPWPLGAAMGDAKAKRSVSEGSPSRGPRGLARLQARPRPARTVPAPSLTMVPKLHGFSRAAALSPAAPCCSTAGARRAAAWNAAPPGRQSDGRRGAPAIVRLYPPRLRRLARRGLGSQERGTCDFKQSPPSCQFGTHCTARIV